MKWIGQHIYDLVSRFRDDVYLEDLSTTTDTSVLVVDSNNKICKNTTTVGDITAVAASNGLTGGGVTGSVTLGLGINLLDTIDPTNDDFLLALDSDGNTHQLSTVESLAGLFAGAGLTAASSVISVDAAQGNVTSLGTLTALDVDNISLNAQTITILGDTSDYLAITTGAAGHTVIATTDAAGEDGHFEIAADGDIILDSAGQIKLEPVAGNNILLDGVLTVDGGTVRPVATAHDAAGTAISIGSGATTAGTTNNIAGGSLTIHGGQGKGSGAGGDIVFKTANAGSSGSTLNSLATALTISDDLSATFAGDIDLAGDIDVDGTLETDALTVGGVAFTPSTTKQFTYHMFKDDIGSTKHYIGLQEADAEETVSSKKNLPLLAPVAGKLLKVFLRANSDLSGDELTWRLETRASSASTFGSPSIIGTVDGGGSPNGCTASSMTTYDFTAVTNTINAGDQVLLSIQSDDDGSDNTNDTHLVTCLWEWDLS